MSSALNLHLENLVLPESSAAERELFVQTLRRELTRLLAEQPPRSPLALQRLDAGVADGRVDAAAALHLARRLHAAMTGGRP